MQVIIKTILYYAIWGYLTLVGRFDIVIIHSLVVGHTYMDPDRKGAPFKIKCNSSDLFTKNQIKEIADSVENMQGAVVNQSEFKKMG